MIQVLEHKQADRSLTLSLDKVDTLSMEVLKAEAMIKITHDSLYTDFDPDGDALSTMFMMLEESFEKIKGMIEPLLKSRIKPLLK